MANKIQSPGRRQFIATLGAIGLAGGFTPIALHGDTARMLKRAIPSSGELLPVVGLGTSRTFDAGDDAELLEQLQQVLQVFFDQGGSLIDTSPMYGSSEYVLGKLLPKVDQRDRLFTATKVWTEGRQEGIEQMRTSQRLMGVPVIDLMQVHNLVDWQVHLETLKEWKATGRIRYIGITTHRGYDHAELTRIMESEPLDFVQFSYSLANRDAEEVLLPLAAEKGIATLINRPYQRGDMFRRVRGRELPDWVAEFDCSSWGQFFLKFILAHPAVTCVIPGTSKVHHMQDNMAAGYGRLPDDVQRQEMIRYYTSL
jgi:aryl-alcohol dehydrogenase-like predicted oxidoreductase